MKGSGHCHTMTTLYLKQEPQCTLHRRLGGPQPGFECGAEGENLCSYRQSLTAFSALEVDDQCTVRYNK